MPEYDFNQLSPHDLEALTRDLLQARWGVHLESFKMGRDGGIDLRYASGPAKIIVQVKHYLRTGFSGLLRDLEKEAVKVRQLAPSRYVLVTSVPLSPINKNAIMHIIGPDFLQLADIVGADDLNNLLDQHPNIEGRHYKLWLASRGVLDRVINNAVVTRSEFKAQQVYEQAKRYVVSDAYPKALKMLAEERVVIIAGAPGVGKTTLADLILYAHLEQGYQAVLIQRDVEEGEKVFQPGLRQIFYFDDFMGATFVGDRAVGSSSSDRVLLNFIAMVRATPDARLVLTTREHIYANALGRSERLRHAGLNDIRVVLGMPSYNTMQRARILYNHLYFSDLPYAYRDELLRDDFYLRIVKHQKFNPRLIEWLSSYRRLKHVPVERYRNFIGDLLHDASEIWQHAYEQEISESGRSVLLAMHSFGGKCGGHALEGAFGVLHAYRATRYNFSIGPDDLRTGIREVVNSFIKPWGSHGFVVIDPSVLDLLNNIVRSAPDNAVDIVAGAACFDQIQQLWTFARAKQGGSIIVALRREAGRIAPSIARLAEARRRIVLDGGGVGYFGPTYERRLAIIVEMAQRLEASAIADLVAPIYAHLIEEWKTERVQIDEAVELIRAMDAFSPISDGMATMRETVLDAALEEARTGCRSYELRELVSVIDAEGSERKVTIARESFTRYQQDYFVDELRECRSRDQFSGLIEDLKLFRDELNVDVNTMIQRVEDAKDEFDEHEDQYADHMQDEWKERYREERESDRSISDMFGSLRGDSS